MAGRCIGREYDVSSVRIVPACFTSGQAAGTAAALAAREGKEVRDLDVASLQCLLAEQGVILDA